MQKPYNFLSSLHIYILHSKRILYGLFLNLVPTSVELKCIYDQIAQLLANVGFEPKSG